MGDPVLRRKSTKVLPQELLQDDVQAGIDAMKGALSGIRAISEENGTAISAPQIGLNKRIVTLRRGDAFLVLINPEITSASREMFDFVEECFSLYYLRGVVQRHQSVTVSYLDASGVQQSRDFEGESAGIIQHEIDHLDGILFIDKVVDAASIATVDYHYKDRPERLQKVKEMYAYMSGQTK